MAGLHAANKLLLAAAADGNLDEVQRLVKLDGASANSSDPSGTTALHAAAMTDDQDLASLLIDLGASVEARECPELGGHTPLLTAVLQGAESVAEVLLEAGAAPDAPEAGSRMTPLHHCARLSDRPQSIAIARLLLEGGADADALDAAGCNPSFYARKAAGRTMPGAAGSGTDSEGVIVTEASGGAAFLSLEGVALPRAPSVEEKHTGLSMRLQAQMALGVKPGKGPPGGKKKKKKGKKK